MRHRTWAVGLAILVVGTAVGRTPVAGAAEPRRLQEEFDRAIEEFDEAQQVLAAEPGRARQLFRSAAQRFESLVSSGLVNGYLEYNLGNCYLQSGDLGRAILHYRRAQRLVPRDPMLADNLAVARTRCLTHVPVSARSTLLRSLFFWHYDSSRRERALAAVAFYVLLWCLLLLHTFVPRRALLLGSATSAVLAATFIGSVATDTWAERHAPAGVITVSDVAVYKGPGTGYQRQFEQPLQPGVEFTIQTERGSWWRVELADGNTGWIESSAGSRVVEPPREPSLGVAASMPGRPGTRSYISFGQAGDRMVPRVGKSGRTSAGALASNEALRAPRRSLRSTTSDPRGALRRVAQGLRGCLGGVSSALPHHLAAKSSVSPASAL